MLWKTVLKNWSEGKHPKYPASRIKRRFFYETAPITTSMNTKYDAKWIESEKLQKLKQNYRNFSKYFKKHKDVVSFINLSKTALLVVPVPRKGKNYTTLKDFMDNASKSQQKMFWKHAASVIRSMLKKYDKLWVSTHGLGVPYLHLRVEVEPKYYKTSSFKH